MPTRILEKNQSRIPFLGDRMSFIHGLDPMGLQNSSVQMYSAILPGLNNVTLRIRYYSFYCWLLGEFPKTIKSKDPAAQKQFIRRAEYIIALASVKIELQGIPGISYAFDRMQENVDGFDLKKGTYNADGSTDHTYWKYGFGIFGQYYLGSLRQLGLVDEPTDEKGAFIGLYRRTANGHQPGISGEELGVAFEQNITPEKRKLFLRCIDEGFVSQQQLDELLPDFNMLAIDRTTNEWRLLIDLLISADKPSDLSDEPLHLRRDTIQQFLHFASQNQVEQLIPEFLSHAYHLQGQLNGSTHASLTGWYYYAFNEYFQVGCTAILNGGLDYLEEIVGPGWIPLPDFIDQASSTILNIVKKEQVLNDNEQSISSIINGLEASEVDLHRAIVNSRSAVRMAYSFLLIWKIYQTNSKNLFSLMEFTRGHHFVDAEDVLTYFLSFEKWLDASVKKYIQNFLLVKVIYRHHYVAFRKMGNGNQSTQKFILENNMIRKVDNFSPVNTSPRLGSLINFLTDLSLLDAQQKVTREGLNLLRDLNSDD